MGNVRQKRSLMANYLLGVATGIILGLAWVNRDRLVDTAKAGRDKDSALADKIRAWIHS